MSSDLSPSASIGGEAVPFGLYLHLPFCLRKCSYCDFASAALDEVGGPPAARRYLDALAVELDLRAASEEFFGAAAETVYLGGGTPTILPPEWLADLLTRLRCRFPFPADAEITIEANPGTVDREKLSALLAAGINRISLGVQSFSDDVLRTLGRAHDAAEARNAIAAARAVGCDNLNLDLIYGVPQQTRDDWRSTLENALESRPEHISTYALSVEPGTPLAREIAAERLPAPDDDLTADMYSLAAELLPEAGHLHYEISNFALPGRECRHNRRYWANAEYLGLGASAHSHRGGFRWNNVSDLGVYVEGLEKGVLPVERAEALSARERVGEMLILGLRRAEGVSEEQVAEQCGLAPRAVFAEEIEQLCEQGLLIAEQGILRLPRDRWLISNEVLAQFVP